MELRIRPPARRLPPTFTADTNGKGGIATISYSDAAGQSLSATDLSNQADAEAALTNLNTAITDVAAQDGYIGAQINTLNSVSQVLSTQQENVTVGAERGAGHRLCVGNLQHVEVRNPEPDRHRRPGAGQQHAAGSDQAAAVTCRMAAIEPDRRGRLRTASCRKPEKGVPEDALFCRVNNELSK